MGVTIAADRRTEHMTDAALANVESLANGTYDSPIDAALKHDPALRQRFNAVGKTRRPAMPSVQSMKSMPPVQTFQTLGQTLGGGTVGNAQTSQSFQTFRQSGKNEVEYAAESLADVPMHDVGYVSGYTPELPKQAVTALAGAKRSGKSTMMLRMCADVSRHHRVLIVQREDPEFILKARLVATGANLGNIRVFHKKASRRGTTVNLGFGPEDLDAIITVAEGYRPELVAIDPLHGLAKGRMNDQSSADCLIDLTTMAQNIDCSVVGVLHTGKDTSDVDTSVSGSDQWIAKCRSHLLLASPPDDDAHAVMQQVSMSYAKTQNRWLTFETKTLQGDDGKPFTVRIVSGMEPTERTVSEIYRLKSQLRAEPVDPDQLPEMAQWMYDTIKAKGTHVFAIDLQRWAKVKGYSANQLRLAYRQAGVMQTKQSCARPKSILYLKDCCTERAAKDWGTGAKPEGDEKSEKSVKSE